MHCQRAGSEGIHGSSQYNSSFFICSGLVILVDVDKASQLKSKSPSPKSRYHVVNDARSNESMPCMSAAGLIIFQLLRRRREGWLLVFGGGESLNLSLRFTGRPSRIATQRELLEALTRCHPYPRIPKLGAKFHSFLQFLASIQSFDVRGALNHCGYVPFLTGIYSRIKRTTYRV